MHKDRSAVPVGRCVVRDIDHFLKSHSPSRHARHRPLPVEQVPARNRRGVALAGAALALAIGLAVFSNRVRSDAQRAMSLRPGASRRSTPAEHGRTQRVASAHLREGGLERVRVARCDLRVVTR